MCFILGAFSLKEEELSEQQVKNVLVAARRVTQLRGRDSIGIYMCSSLGASIHRFSLGEVALDEVFSRVDPPSQRCIMIQSRALPETEMVNYEQVSSLKNTQPFENVGWAISHGGNISNDAELRREFPKVGWDFEPRIDSAVLPYMFLKYGVVDTLKNRVNGSFAIAAFERASKTFYLAKNFQPLYYDIIDGILCYSSLPCAVVDFKAVTEMPAYSALEVNASGVIKKKISLYRKQQEDSVLVCFSSGLDSAVTLRLYQVLGYKVAALHFSYGQSARHAEAVCAEMICKKLGIPLYNQVLDMSAFTSQLLHHDSLPNDLNSLEDAETTLSYVPQRNLIMASYALAYAEQLGYGAISLGMNLSDGGAYPDNGIPFLYKMNEITPYSSNWQTRLRVTSPLVNLMKSEIIEIGLKIGVPFEYVCSCYYPSLSVTEPIYCGKCGSDMHYEYAWRRLGYRPPNLGFNMEDSSLIDPPQWDSSPDKRLSMETMPYWKIIKETM